MGTKAFVKSSMTFNHHAIDRVKNILSRQARGAHNHVGSVGIHEADGAEPKIGYDGKATDATLAEVAAIHEFGERSWLRVWFDDNEPRLRKEMTDAARREFEGEKGAVEALMIVFSLQLRVFIKEQEGQLKALSPSTVAKKSAANLSRPDTPLYATGQLVEAIRSMIDGVAQ